MTDIFRFFFFCYGMFRNGDIPFPRNMKLKVNDKNQLQRKQKPESISAFGRKDLFPRISAC